MLTNLDSATQAYLTELQDCLSDVPQPERDNHIAEIRDHLHSYVHDLRSQGFPDEQIEQKMHQEYLPPRELASQIAAEYTAGSSMKKRIGRIRLIFPLVLVVAVSFVLPHYRMIPLSLLLFALSYLVSTKKWAWGFAVVRKNADQIRNRGQIARLGGIYLFLIGLVILIGEFIDLRNRNLVMVAIIAVCSLSFSLYVYRINRKIDK